MAETATPVVFESPTDCPRPRICVLSDNLRLCRLITYLLADDGPVVGWAAQAESQALPTFEELHAVQLIIIAVAAVESEPLALLAQARLTALVGRTPLLLITDRPFNAPLGNSIYHLNYPFTAEALLKIVRELCSA